MKYLKIFPVLICFFALASVCRAQSGFALVDTKSFYLSENGIPSLKDALKSANPSFPALTDEEKEKEFKRIFTKCRAANDKTSEAAALAPGAKEAPACAVLKDITDGLESFRKKRNLLFIVDAGAYDYITDITDDVTKEFIDEYNGAKK